MAVQESVPVRTARAQALADFNAGAPGPPKLRVYSGAMPANAAAAATGTLLVEIALPSTFWTTASGVNTKAGTWIGTAIAAGTVGYFRLVDNTGTTCVLQGTVGTSGTDMIIDNASILLGQALSVLTFTLTELNA